MRRAIGVSTHAISPGDVLAALASLRPLNLPAVELSVLRVLDPKPVLEAIGPLDLSGYSYVSFHAPSTFDRYTEQDVVNLLAALVALRWPVVAHPDTLNRDDLWEPLGDQLCIENMDKRKAVGRTTAELEAVFARFPRASFCFDIGHARQVDPTMSEAALILRRFGDRLRLVHLSEVNSLSRHEGITYTALNSFRKVAPLIPAGVPVILETPLPADQIEAQIQLAEQALTPADQDALPSQSLNGSAKAGRLSLAGDPVRP
jgi:hypothetical protein